MDFKEIQQKYNDACARLGDAVVRHEALERLIENLKLEISDLQVKGSQAMKQPTKPELVKDETAA